MSRLSLEEVYERLPSPFQHVATSAYGLRQARLRYGPDFRHRLGALRRTDSLSLEELQRAQRVAVHELLLHAARAVPAYRERLAAVDLDADDPLAGVPILTKADVRADPERFVAEGVSRRRLVPRKTSGTTGSSLRFYSTRASLGFQWAVWWRHRLRFGVAPGTWHANFTGQPAVPSTTTRPPYWRWNVPLRQVVLSMQTLTPATAPAIARFLDRRGFELWTGYPSVVHAFAAAAAEAGVRLERPPRVIALGAEPVLDFQRRDIEMLTGAIVTDQWGLSEGCGNASQCPAGRYHEDMEFCLLECVDPVPLEDGRTRGRLVATGFACPEFPFVRYDTGDDGIWAAADDPCACGRESRTLLAIEGRSEDYVLTPEGGRIMRFDYLFKDTPTVREAQVVQEREGAITIRIVRGPGWRGDEEAYLRREVGRWVSPRLAVGFAYPDEIERGPGGKFRPVKSTIAGRT